MMNCPFCQADLPEGATFCAQCGKSLAEQPKSEPAPATEADAVTEAVQNAVITESTEPAPKNDPAIQAPAAPAPTAPLPKRTVSQPKKRPLWLRTLCGFFSAILLTVAIVLGIALGAILMVQNITSPDTIRLMISEMDLSRMEITIEGESKTVADAVHEVFADAQAENGNPDQAIAPEQVDKLLEADFVKDFLAEKAYDMSEDLLNNTSESEMTSDEIRSFITDNRSNIEEILEVEITDEMADGIAADLEEAEVLKKMSVSSITDNAPEITSILKMLTSTVAWILFGVLLFVFALIALINWFRPITLSYAGVTFLIVGGLFGALAVLIRALVGWIAEMLNISVSILNFIVTGIVTAASKVFVLGLVAGIVLIAAAIGYTILRSILRKRAK